MLGAVALHCSVQSLKTSKPFSFHSQVKIVYLPSQSFFGWFTLSEISSLTILKQCKNGYFLSEVSKTFRLGPWRSFPCYLSWTLTGMESYGQSTMSQMRRCFFSFISDELLGCTHPHDWSKFIKLMENTWKTRFPSQSVKPFYILHYRCANVVPSHLEKLVFWQKSITWKCFARPKKHQKEMKEI